MKVEIIEESLEDRIEDLKDENNEYMTEEVDLIKGDYADQIANLKEEMREEIKQRKSEMRDELKQEIKELKEAWVEDND